MISVDVCKNQIQLIALAEQSHANDLDMYATGKMTKSSKRSPYTLKGKIAVT